MAMVACTEQQCIYSNSYFFDLEQVWQWLQQASQCMPVQDRPQTRTVHQS
jgi:hypothetical protein